MCQESICDDCTCKNYVFVKRNGINQRARFCGKCFQDHEQKIEKFQKKLNKKNAQRLLEFAQTDINNNDECAEGCILAACLAVGSLLAN